MKWIIIKIAGFLAVVSGVMAMEELTSPSLPKQNGLFQLCGKKMVTELMQENPPSFNLPNLPQDVQGDLLNLIKQEAWHNPHHIATLNGDFLDLIKQEAWRNPHYIATVSFHGNKKKLTGFTDDRSSLTCAFTPNGEYLALGSRHKLANMPANINEVIKIWDMRNAAQPNEKTTLYNYHDEKIGGILSLVFSPSGYYLVSGSRNHTITIWDWAHSDQPRVATIDQSNGGHADMVFSLAFSPDGQQMVSGSVDRSIKVWDLHNVAKPHGIKTLVNENNTDYHDDTVSSVAVSPDGTYLVSGSWDKTIKIWNMQNIEQLQNSVTLKKNQHGHTDSINVLIVSADGRYMISGSRDGIIKVWDMQDATQPQCISTLVDRYSDFPASFTLSPDGKFLAVGRRNGNITIWNMQHKAEPQELVEFCHEPLSTDLVVAVLFSPDGQYLVSNAHDGSIKIWNANLFNVCATLQQALTRT